MLPKEEKVNSKGVLTELTLNPSFGILLKELRHEVIK